MGGRSGHASTQHLRLAQSRRNESAVLAESALLGERRVGWARLAMMALFGVTSGVVAPALGTPPWADAQQRTVIALYALFALASLVIVYRRRPDPRRALLMPLLVMLVDNGFLTYMGVRDFQLTGRAWPEMGAAAFMIVLAFSVARYHWLHIAVAVVLACAGYLVVAAWGGILPSFSAPFVLGGFAALGVLMLLTNRSVRRMFGDLRRRDNLSRLLPQPVVEQILTYGSSALVPVQRDVTILFSDIRGFTSMSERMNPQEVLELLAEYFGHMAQVVKGHDGMVNKFLGDGMLAVWGVPERRDDHAERAVRAALDMRTRLEELNASLAKSGRRPLRIGVGIHSGPVAAGMLGGDEQAEYTVIGDAVNVASRIEGLTKALGADVLVSASTWERLGDRFAGDRVSSEQLKGRSAPVVVYALAPEGDSPAPEA